MNNKHTSPAQFELFPETSPQKKEVKKVRYLLKDLTLSVENIIVLAIILVMTLVVFFSYGVEQGKKTIAVNNLKKNNSVTVKPQVIEKQAVNLLSKEIKSSVKKNLVVSSVESEIIEAESEKSISVDVFSEEESLEKEKKIIEDGYTIQVASFKLEKNAKKEALRLKDKGHNTFVIPKGDYSIVCVGKFVEKIQAQKFSHKLKDRYRDLLVRRF